MAHVYSHLYGIPTTGLRFFSVYGPWGRPDGVAYLWTSAILENRPVKVYNHGKMRRSFTYVSDIVEGVTRVLSNPAAPAPEWTGQCPDPGSSSSPLSDLQYRQSQRHRTGVLSFPIRGFIGQKSDPRRLAHTAWGLPG